MNSVLLLPFAYFYTTRLSKGSLAFHALFEWLAAAWVVAWVGVFGIKDSMLVMVLKSGRKPAWREDPSPAAPIADATVLIVGSKLRGSERLRQGIGRGSSIAAAPGPS